MINLKKFTIEIKELDNGRFKASIPDTDFVSGGIYITDAINNLLAHIKNKDWKDKQDAEIREQYPKYFN
jgi:hypothetical protein